MIDDPSCHIDSTRYYNRLEQCRPLKPYLKKRVDDRCALARPVPLTENIGMVGPIDRLPGCNPVTYSNARTCSQGADPSTMNNIGTFHIQSKITGGYLTFDRSTGLVLANSPSINPSYREVWGFVWSSRYQGYFVRNSEVYGQFTMDGKLKVDDVVADSWDIFSFEQQPNSDYLAIKSFGHDKYLKVERDFTISARATSITEACLFKPIIPDGGFVPEGIRLTDIGHLTRTHQSDH